MTGADNTARDEQRVRRPADIATAHLHHGGSGEGFSTPVAPTHARACIPAVLPNPGEITK